MNVRDFKVDDLVFNADGLIPVVVQDVFSKDVLMMAYMNKEAVIKTINERKAYYFSRKRQKLWQKGETSGHFQTVYDLDYDCDADTLLMKVKQSGVACHKNKVSCFHNPILSSESNNQEILATLVALIKERKLNPKPDSYTNYLFDEGLDKILKKVGEESSEVIIASKNQSQQEMVYEISDLLYHLLVLMVHENVEVNAVFDELAKRRK